MCQNDREMQSIVMKDIGAREQATKHFFDRAQRQVMDG
jgi:type I restriction enzyme R subunit